MIERKDASLTSSDECTVMLQSGNGTGTPVSLKFSFKDGKIVCSDANVKVASCILGTLDDTTEDDGLTIEFSIPKSFLGIVSDKLLFNAVVKDDISGEDTFFGLTANNYQKWFRSSSNRQRSLLLYRILDRESSIPTVLNVAKEMK